MHRNYYYLNLTTAKVYGELNISFFTFYTHLSSSSRYVYSYKYFVETYIEFKYLSVCFTLFYVPFVRLASNLFLFNKIWFLQKLPVASNSWVSNYYVVQLIEKLDYKELRNLNHILTYSFSFYALVTSTLY